MFLHFFRNDIDNKLIIQKASATDFFTDMLFERLFFCAFILFFIWLDYGPYQITRRNVVIIFFLYQFFAVGAFAAAGAADNKNNFLTGKINRFGSKQTMS